jgi:hypothetical protein
MAALRKDSKVMEHARKKESTSEINDITIPNVLLKVSGYTSKVLLFRSVIEGKNNDV